MQKLSAASLGEVAEVLRGVCVEQNGEVLLDEAKVRSIEDVQKALDARDHEKSDHKATRERLAEWTRLGKTAEEVQSILDEYPTLKEGAKAGEDFLTEKKKNLALQREYDKALADLKLRDEEVAGLKAYKESALKSAAWKTLREELGKTYDSAKLDTVFEDNSDKFTLDEIGEFKPFRNMSVKDFMINRAKAMGWELPNTPGGSNPGEVRTSGKIPTDVRAGQTAAFSGNILDDDIIAKLDS